MGPGLTHKNEWANFLPEFSLQIFKTSSNCSHKTFSYH